MDYQQQVKVVQVHKLALEAYHRLENQRNELLVYQQRYPAVSPQQNALMLRVHPIKALAEARIVSESLKCVYDFGTLEIDF